MTETELLKGYYRARRSVIGEFSTDFETDLRNLHDEVQEYSSSKLGEDFDFGDDSFPHLDRWWEDD